MIAHIFCVECIGPDIRPHDGSIATVEKAQAAISRCMVCVKRSCIQRCMQEQSIQVNSIAPAELAAHGTCSLMAKCRTFIATMIQLDRIPGTTMKRESVYGTGLAEAAGGRPGASQFHVKTGMQKAGIGTHVFRSKWIIFELCSASRPNATSLAMILPLHPESEWTCPAALDGCSHQHAFAAGTAFPS